MSDSHEAKAEAVGDTTATATPMTRRLPALRHGTPECHDAIVAHFRRQQAESEQQQTPAEKE